MEDLIKVTRIVNLKNLTVATAIEDKVIDNTIKFLTPSQILEEYDSDLTEGQREKLLHKEKLYREISLSPFRKTDEEKFIELHKQIYETE